MELQRELESEIAALQVQLRQSQDPDRMQLIQEMISVRHPSCLSLHLL
jgi:hypothetical protein